MKARAESATSDSVYEDFDKESSSLSPSSTSSTENYQSPYLKNSPRKENLTNVKKQINGYVKNGGGWKSDYGKLNQNPVVNDGFDLEEQPQHQQHQQLFNGN